MTQDQAACAAVKAHQWAPAKREAGGQFARSQAEVGDRRSHRKHLSRRLLSQQAGVSEHKIEHARTLQKASPELLDEVIAGTITLTEALIKIRRETPAAPPAEDGLLISRRRKLSIEDEAKERIIRVLSRVHGLCHGLETLSIPTFRKACDAKEIKEWAGIARSAARGLRGFAASLLAEEKEQPSEAHI